LLAIVSRRPRAEPMLYEAKAREDCVLWKAVNLRTESRGMRVTVVEHIPELLKNDIESCKV